MPEEGTPSPSSRTSPSPPVAPTTEAPLGAIDGLADLEREIAELLDAPTTSMTTLAAPGLPRPPTPSTPPFEPPLPGIRASAATPAGHEAELRAEVLRLRGALENLREEIVQHRSHLAGVHGELARVSSALTDIRPAPSPPRPPAATPPEPRPSPMSAAPVFFLDEKGQNVASQAFFTLGKGGALEHFLTEVLQAWESSGYPIQTKGGAEGFSLTLEGDPEGRGLKLLPSGMYLMRLGSDEMGKLQKLPPLVSSKVLGRSGAFAKRPSR